MFNISLPLNDIDFKTLEKEIYQRVLKYGREQIKTILEQLDVMIMESRDKAKYRNICIKKTSIKTVMGTIEYSRRIYRYYDEDGNKHYISLLDEYLKIDKTIGQMSVNLVEKIIENATNMSYRKTAHNITELTGQDISHQAAWDVVQKMGEKIQEQEKQKIKAYEKGKLKGKREVKVLFEESDGLYINMQGKDRKGGSGRKKEAKKVSRMIKKLKIDQALNHIEQLKYECGGEVKEVKKLETLQQYLTNNRDGLIPYKQRKNIKLPAPPEGISYRNLGTMEHNICDILYLRMPVPTI